MSSEISIKVENLSKCYQIYNQPRDRLKQFVMPRIRRMAGVQPKQYFREFWALRDVSFEVKKGETVGIIGRNGSGKSTLLQMICGTLNPTSGSITSTGRIAALLELGSGFNPEFTGRENVYMNGAVLGLAKEEIDARFDDIAAFADIGIFIEQPVKTYSSGMLVRLAFAVAINVDPEILIVDEALSVGDELFQRKCFSRIETIKNKGASVLFVSHSVSTINQLCNEAILVDRGTLLLRGLPRDITRSYHQLLFSRDESEVIASFNERSLDISNDVAESKPSETFFGEYIDGLVVPTPLSYQTKGGEIVSFELLDGNSKKVNIVSTGFSGRAKLRVRFDSSFSDVIFGFHLRTISGLEISGLSFPSPQDELVAVESGDLVEVLWELNLPFTAGTYFFTFGVRSISDGGFIDRVVDGGVVKVIETQKSSAFGLLDISNKGRSSITKLIQGFAQ